jgi:DNA repair exonuclease SbcCD ATPase subunit
LVNFEGLNDLADKDKVKFVQRLKDESKKQQELEEKQIQLINSAIEKYHSESEKLKETRTQFEKQQEDISKKLRDATEREYKKERELSDLKKQLEKQELENKKIQDEMKEREIQDFVNRKVNRWRNSAKVILSATLFIYFAVIATYLYRFDWDVSLASKSIITLKSNLVYNVIVYVFTILVGIVIKLWYDRHHNHSNIENYKKSVERSAS